MNYKELVNKPQKFAPGHRSCAGCGFPQIVRTVLASTDDPIVASCATGCLEVTSTIYPFSSWKIPFIHNAFENSAATISGVEAAYKALKRKGKIPKNKKIKFVAFGGDGGTYDIGLQSLSGALERGHDFVYILYDNEAYMNTGVQRSSSTPFGASTTTAPAGKVHQGKEEWKKDIMQIVAAHHVPYVAQASVHNPIDLSMKAKKAFECEGPAFLVVLQPCTLGWKYHPSMTIDIAKMAVESKFWPLYEVENGKYKLNYTPSKPIPIADYLKPQGRFKHLFKPDNKGLLEEMQKKVDERWDELVKKCE
ncbi:pyruvate ferredoxin oxidoreductase, partial [Candidatus Woesearchaeota archaeon]|nr:pyruvate ferredoxin oxidoreductase [Candidatus Woesearchaeota archaeon]MBT5271703.1 pyruvate ferredoxin oxidoreductase [Candidatus Woesearchaeota archaeon]MBT6041107.1 pyruvate ferredoxin oxidoreductase [Candidatus Woesearchaeota archaeon]MBT6337432.1 pyruvate ferredoxin oxidoreductase [Candidatus Woesearchaeota archaeon]MBT7926704.1 pyruvate ferredoxin oxidoreductase [Candidatus Woesearchaeota archaeon]